MSRTEDVFCTYDLKRSNKLLCKVLILIHKSIILWISLCTVYIDFWPQWEISVHMNKWLYQLYIKYKNISSYQSSCSCLTSEMFTRMTQVLTWLVRLVHGFKYFKNCLFLLMYTTIYTTSEKKNLNLHECLKSIIVSIVHLHSVQLLWCIIVSCYIFVVMYFDSNWFRYFLSDFK